MCQVFIPITVVLCLLCLGVIFDPGNLILKTSMSTNTIYGNPAEMNITKNECGVLTSYQLSKVDNIIDILNGDAKKFLLHHVESYVITLSGNTIFEKIKDNNIKRVMKIELNDVLNEYQGIKIITCWLSFALVLLSGMLTIMHYNAPKTITSQSEEEDEDDDF